MISLVKETEETYNSCILLELDKVPQSIADLTKKGGSVRLYVWLKVK